MSNPLYLLDTGVLLILLRGGEHAARIEDGHSLRDSGIRPLISIVTHGEISVLAARNAWGSERREALAQALHELVTVDINHPDVIAAYVDIELHSQAHPEGARNMGKNDLWIAACAKAAGATLLTTDGDFEHLNPPMLDVTTVAVRQRARRYACEAAPARPARRAPSLGAPREAPPPSYTRRPRSFRSVRADEGRGSPHGAARARRRRASVRGGGNGAPAIDP